MCFIHFQSAENSLMSFHAPCGINDKLQKKKKESLLNYNRLKSFRQTKIALKGS